MNRDTALFSLEKFRPLATAVGITLFLDDEEGFGPAFDAALRDLGYAEANLATADTLTTENAAYLALLDYYVLDLLSIRAILFVDIEIGSDQRQAKKRSQVFDHITKLKDLALVKAKGFGYLGSDFVLGEINTAYLEPLADSEI